MNKVKVKPKNGLIIRMPDRDLKPIPTQGVMINLNEYYRARIDEGDLIIIDDNKNISEKSKAGVTSD